MLGAKAEAEAKAKSILDGKAASARLDCAKIELAEKRGVLDSVYEKALKKLKELDKKTAVALAGGLLAKYAEDGDLESSCQEALRQIKEKRYDAALLKDGMKKIITYGIAFYKKYCKVILG